MRRLNFSIVAFVAIFAVCSFSASPQKESAYFNGGVSSKSPGKVKAIASCPKDFPLLDEQGYCHPCNEEGSIRLIDKTSCEKLCNGKNGKPKRVDVFWGCKLEKCPKNKPLEDSFGKCKTCKYDGPVSDTLNCAQCSNRVIKDGKCVIADCTNRPLLGSDGSCYPCSTALSVPTLSGKCTSVCPNRHENGSWWNTSKDGVKVEGVNCDYGSEGDE